MNQEILTKALTEFANTPEGQKFCEQAIKNYSKSHPEELVERRKTSLNTKPQERGEKFRGTIEGLENYRKHNLAIVPLEILKSVLEEHGVEFVDETGKVV